MLIDLLRPNPDRTWRERFASFIRKALLILESALVSAVLTVFWYCVFWRNGWVFSHESEVIVSTFILVQQGLLTIIAAISTIKVVDRSEAMSKCVRARDKKGFMGMRDMRLPMRLHNLFGILGIGLLLHVYRFGYHNAQDGAYFVFVTTFSVIAYFSITMELQDPELSAWFRTTAPPEWLTEDAKEYFARLHKRRVPRSEE